MTSNQLPKYMNVKRQAVVLQAIAKKIAEDADVNQVSPSLCGRAIKDVEECSADLVQLLKQAEQSARDFLTSAQEPS